MPPAANEKRAISGRSGAKPRTDPPCEIEFILDAGALLTYLRGDEGGAIVQRVLGQCKDCSVKAGIAASDMLEVLTASARESPGMVEDLISLMDQLPLDVRPVTRDTATAVAQCLSAQPALRPSQALGLSMAALTEASNGRKATLVTADPGLSGFPDCLYVGPRGGNPGA